MTPRVVTSDFIPPGVDAFTVWPFIFVRPESAKDAALLEHEWVHATEQRATWVIPWLLRYAFSKKFRLAAEVRAYRVQIAGGGITREGAAVLLSTQYRLGLTYAQALEVINHAT